MDILLFLHNNPELCTASDICRYRALAKSNVSAAVERLRSRGVLTVSPAPGNRRQRLLGFTDEGCTMAAALAEIQRRSIEPLLPTSRSRNSRPCRTICAAWMPTSCAASKGVIVLTYLIKFIVCFIAGIGAGLGTGCAGVSAAAVISPMLITFFGIDRCMAVGIALASDVLASAISAYTYGKNGNLDIKNGAVMMAAVLCFTLVGSYVASLLPGTTMGGFSTFMTFLLGVKFIVRPVMTTKNAMNAVSAKSGSRSRCSPARAWALSADPSARAAV